MTTQEAKEKALSLVVRFNGHKRLNVNNISKELEKVERHIRRELSVSKDFRKEEDVRLWFGQRTYYKEIISLIS